MTEADREQNRGYPRLKPTARYREQRSKAGQDSGQMSGLCSASHPRTMPAKLPISPDY
ncbi:hypothetical protein [Thermoleptolyngbya sp.]